MKLCNKEVIYKRTIENKHLGAKAWPCYIEIRAIVKAVITRLNMNETWDIFFRI